MVLKSSRDYKKKLKKHIGEGGGEPATIICDPMVDLSADAFKNVTNYLERGWFVPKAGL